MRVLVACVRGNIADRSKSGHCLCQDCVDFRRAGWRKRNKDRAEYKKAWLEKNREKVAQYSKQWTEKNKEKRQETVTSWRERNPDKVKEYSAKAGRKWSQKNRGKRLSSVRARQLAKKQRTPIWACLEEISKIYEQAAFLTKTTGIPHEVDHIIPLQGENVSGLHVHWNLQILPRSENRKKGNRI